MEELYIPRKGKAFRLEKEFTTWWLRQLKDKGYYADKISDASIGTKMVDCYILSDQSFYVCEIKVIESNKFKIGQLRPNQFKALRLAETLSSNCSIVVVYSKKYNDYRIIPFNKIKDIDKNDFVQLKFK